MMENCCRSIDVSRANAELQTVLSGVNFDIVGLAWTWAEPSNSTLRDQHMLEAFYRFMITPHTHLTPDMQVILDPANAPGKTAVTVFGLRVRTLY